jgi:hypothetical protein
MVTASASSPSPDDVRQILNDLEANERRAQALVADLDSGSLNWRADDRSWSTAQCLDHLNVANRVYLEAMRPSIEEARRQRRMRKGPVRPGWFERWFVANLEPPPKRKLSAPKKIVPAFRGEKDALVAEFRRLHGEIDVLLRESADLDLGVRFPNPFIPLLRFRAWTGFLVMPAHERRHLWQAEQLRTKPGFPGKPPA